MTRITIRHMRAAKICSSGARAFFLRHQIDWQEFLKYGVADTILLATGDAMAAKVVELARAKT